MSSSQARIRVIFSMEGVLQGVGFRPTMQVLAEEAGLGGSVQNRSGSVRLALEGTAEAIDAFVATLPERLPIQARLDRIEECAREALPSDEALASFHIEESYAALDESTRISIPADLAMCPNCRREVFDPDSRFYGYPFTTCTNCGPRYTVVNGVPYDREQTTLRDFPLCPDCLEDYRDVRDRRFHAESIACPTCGPQLELRDANWAPLSSDPSLRASASLRDPVLPGSPSPLIATRAALARGEIVAVRGLGGFLLAADAFDALALGRLRDRKRRPDKPFAVMGRDLGVLKDLVHLSEAAAAELTSPRAPIVIADLRAEAGDEGLPVALLSPDTDTLGVMLPTTPLHALLIEALPGDPTPSFELLVMTSGNRGGEPICITNDEARDRLCGIADAFLLHDREINLRNDDSLVVDPMVSTDPGASTGHEEQLQTWRRARGFAPDSLRLARPLQRRVLAMGAELKNCIALGFDQEIVLSPHIGDLSTPEALDGMNQVVGVFPEYFRRPPERIAVDLHPDMHATRLGRRVAAEQGLEIIEVQHHHAHAAAAMAEHGLERALALIFDGTGLGDDGSIWGAELMEVGRTNYKRLGSFSPVPLPGGDAAVRQPVRQLAARAQAAGVELSAERRRHLNLTDEELALWTLQCARGLNAPQTHAAGRLFDAAAVLAGVAPQVVSYEGQAAIRLEALARRATPGAGQAPLPFSTRIEGDLLLIDWTPLFARVVEAPLAEHERASWARAFHDAVARAALVLARHGRERSGLDLIVLTGGVWMNRLLTSLAVPMLRAEGFDPRLPRLIPPNDGGIAAGQAWIAGGL